MTPEEEALIMQAGELSPHSRLWKGERKEAAAARARDAYEDLGVTIGDAAAERRSAAQLSALRASFEAAAAAAPIVRPPAPVAYDGDPGHLSVFNGSGIEQVERPEHFDAIPNWLPDYPDAEEITAEQMHALFRDSVYLSHVKNRAGEIVTEEKREEARKAREILDAQSMEIALSLQAAGVPAFDENAKKLKPCIVDPIAQKVLPLVPFRRVNFIPAAAAQRRAPMLKHLESHLLAHPLTKMGTFTNGPRVWLNEIRAAIEDQHRRLSKLNAGLTFRLFGAQFHFRATELGSLVRACRWPRTVTPSPQTGFEGIDPGADDPGELLAHIHSHVFYSLPLTEAWSWFIGSIWDEWGAHWDHGRTIADAREACKYPVKPADMAFCHMTSEETAELYRQLRGLHLVQAMGELRPRIRRRRAKALKGLKYRIRGGADDGALVLKWKYDPNAKGPRDLEAQALRAALAARERKAALARFVLSARFAAAAAACECPAAAAACLWLAVWFAVECPANDAEKARQAKKSLKLAERAAKAGKPRKNQICARLAPATYWDRVTRPALLVWNFDGDFAALARHKVVADLIQAAKPLIETAETKLETEREELALSVIQSSHQSRNCPDMFLAAK
jgi:hypothetical protein